MRIFALCTGRCGSTTFTYACKHMENFTTGHESRAKFIGAERLKYPDNHIEVDNRLCWFLGRLERLYGDDAYYVHLTRDAGEVAASYARRISNPASIGAAHKQSILMNTPHDEHEVCVDVVDTMLKNIEHFLSNKTNVMHVALETVEVDFARFWHWIGAKGDLDAALSEWRVRYNDSEKSHGAISHPVPKTEAGSLRKERRKLLSRIETLDTEVADLKRLQEESERRRQEIEELQQETEKRQQETESRKQETETLLEEAEHKRSISEQARIELETRLSTIEALWREESSQLRAELSERNKAVRDLNSNVGRMTRLQADLSGMIDEIANGRDALLSYADEVEARYRGVLMSRTWRIFGPYRFVSRTLRGWIYRRPAPRSSLPDRPIPDSEIERKLAALRARMSAKWIPMTRKLDKRLWGGFSQSALPMMRNLIDDPDRSAQERADAAFHLARWYYVQGDFERALEEIRRMRVLYPSCAEESRQYLPEALFLCRLGMAEEARRILEKDKRSSFNTTAKLLLANTWNPEVSGVTSPASEANVLAQINSIYNQFGLAEIAKRDSSAPMSMDNLQAAHARREIFDPNAKVTIIVPAFNAAETIGTALTSIAEQTWQNLEVLVVDDVSTDRTVDIVKEFCANDSRFRLIRQTENGGSYVCRNRALEEASGDFITVHDSDDWSHPDKIRCQVEHLKKHLGPYNLAMWVRTTSTLSFFGNSRAVHDLVRPDHSSGLFPRETLERFGSWDTVRISADTELYWRIESALGNKKWMFSRRHVLKDCPLSFGRMSDTSLTQVRATSVMTIFHGVRREYREAADFWHASNGELSKQQHVSSSMTLFPVPTLLDSTDKRTSGVSVLMIADWNVNSSIRDSAMKEVARVLQFDESLHGGLLHYPHFYSDVTAPLNHRVRKSAWKNRMKVLSPGEVVIADVVLVLTPGVFEHQMDRFPDVTYDRLIILPDPEVSTTSWDGKHGVDYTIVREHVVDCFGSDGEWIQTIDELRELLIAGLPLENPKLLLESVTAGESVAGTPS